MAARASRAAKAKRGVSSSPSAKVAALSEAILESLLASQKKAPAPQGLLKCPRCGAAVEPTKNGRIRTHDADPYERLRCPASGRPWKEFGGEPKATRRKAATKRPKTRAKRTKNAKKK